MLTDLCRTQLNDNGNLFPFHDPATDQVDCNVAQASQALELVTGVQLDAKATRTFGQEATGPTGNVFARKAFMAQGLVAEIDYRMLWSAPTDDVRNLLKLGWYVVLYVDYGIINAQAPQISGDKNFDGYHAIGLSDWWRGKLGVSVHYHDPLADGRHPLTPKGVQVAKFSNIRDAAYGYTHKPGLVQGYAVMPAE
jgi:hypothetical protein